MAETPARTAPIRARLVSLARLAAVCLALVAMTASSASATTTVKSWGRNDSGQLGIGTTTGPGTCFGVSCSVSAVPVSGLSGVTAVSAAGFHTLALLSNGTVMSWGENRWGELGDGSESASDVPVEVPGLAGVTAVAAGTRYSLALLRNGTVMAWGNNALGELGDGTIAQSDIPVAVSGLSGVSAIAAGENSAMALLENGTVMVWGSNDGGELGDGSETGPESCEGEPCSTVPMAVSGLSGVVSVAAGQDTDDALLGNGTVMAWGKNEWGDLGAGTSTGPEICSDAACSKTPVAVSGLTGVSAISAGMWHEQALLGDGTIEAWGDNLLGELGDGEGGVEGGPEECIKNPCSTHPVAVSGLANVTAMSAGSFNSGLAVLSDGTVSSWGGNVYGELGDGSNHGPQECFHGAEPCSTSPVSVTGLSGASAVAGGSNFNLAIAAEAGPTALTEPAAPLSATEEQLNASVDPNGESVSDCQFQWGASSSYGHTAPCTPAPASGGTQPVNVSTTISGLTADAQYHYRVLATGAGHTYVGGDRTFTTLLSSASASTDDPSTPASVLAAPLSGTASGGTGAITVGPYSADPAATATFMSSGDYFDVNLSAGNSFGEVQFSDCELNGGAAIYWEDDGVWEPVSDETAPAGGCITVTVNSSTSPDLSEMGGTVFAAVLPPQALPEIGRCRPAMSEKRGSKSVYHGRYTNSGCTTVSATRNGRYEWTQSYAKGGASGKSGAFTIETTGKAKIACSASVTDGHYTGEGIVASIVLSGCTSSVSHTKCQTPGSPEGVIETTRLVGTLGSANASKHTVGVALKPSDGSGVLASFECGGGGTGTQERLEDGVIAEFGKADKMSSTLSFTFKESKGRQAIQALEGQGPVHPELSTGPSGSATTEEAGVKAKSTSTGEEPLEIKAIA
jgi:alpha-tubulin suppressor-like RCC1 family protein